jgi:hypothetical protein
VKRRLSFSSLTTLATLTIADKARLHVAEQLRQRAEEQQRQADEIALRVTAMVTYHKLMSAVHPE